MCMYTYIYVYLSLSIYICICITSRSARRASGRTYNDIYIVSMYTILSIVHTRILYVYTYIHVYIYIYIICIYYVSPRYRPDVLGQGPARARAEGI